MCHVSRGGKLTAGGGNNGNGFNAFLTENGSSQNLALTGLFVPRSLESGMSAEVYFGGGSLVT